MPRRADRPDIELGAAVKAKKLRFDRAPDTEVRRAGEWSSVSDRRNLPEEVEPGVTYRDVRVGWRAGVRLRLRR
jgi:hypothetical protein